MPQVHISEQLFKRLQKQAIPLIDTIESVIEKALVVYECNRDNKTIKHDNSKSCCPELALDHAQDKGSNNASVQGATQTQDYLDKQEPTTHSVLLSKSYDADHPPLLKHTRVLAATFDGLTATGWNDLLKVAHGCALNRVKSVAAVQELSRARVAEGERVDKGYHYHPDLGISIGNVEAKTAWPLILHLAKRLRVPVSVKFEWNDKVQAAFAGKIGSLNWSPSTQEN